MQLTIFSKRLFQVLLLSPVIIKEPWPVGAQTVRTVGCGNWQRNTGGGSAGPYRVGRRGHLFSSWFQLNNLSCASRLFWTACAVWPGVLRCWWVGGSVVAGRCRPKDSQQLHHNRMIIVAHCVCHLVLMLWLIELQVSVKIGIPIILDSIFHKLYFVLWALRSSALFKEI